MGCELCLYGYPCEDGCLCECHQDKGQDIKMKTYEEVVTDENVLQEMKPNEFYFHAEINEDVGGSMITICPIVYFEEEKCLYDQCFGLDAILPEDFDETMEAVWECERSLEEVKKDLLARGFVENKNFSNFLSRGE